MHSPEREQSLNAAMKTRRISVCYMCQFSIFLCYLPAHIIATCNNFTHYLLIVPSVDFGTIGFFIAACFLVLSSSYDGNEWIEKNVPNFTDS